MSVNNSGQSPLHLMLTNHLLKIFLDRGYSYLSINNYSGRHIPDAFAHLNGHYLIGEAETTDSLNTPHTQSQIKEFSSYNNATLVLCVPNPVKLQAQILVAKHCINAEVISMPMLPPITSSAFPFLFPRRQ